MFAYISHPLFLYVYFACLYDFKKWIYDKAKKRGGILCFLAENTVFWYKIDQNFIFIQFY